MQRTTTGSQRNADGPQNVCGEGSRVAKIASERLRTTQDIKDLGLALAEDIILGQMSHKAAGPVCRSITMSLRTAEFEMTRGNGQPIGIGSSERTNGRPQPDPVDLLIQKERELLEQLEAVRKERLATN